MPDIWFPYLGIEISDLSKTAFSIGSFSVAWYGIIIALGVLSGLLLARHLAKKSGQDPELYVDFLIYALIFSIIGVRLYYVAFSWDQYAGDWSKIFNLRNGGLAIYGGVIGAIATAIVYCKIKHYSLLELLDTAMPGLILGQAIGRWGNFFNQEAFGGYTDSFFAMRLNTETAAYTTTELLQQTVTSGGVRYIQVHPTFLYESMWCLFILAIMLFVFKKRKYKGIVTCLYMIGYGIGRAFIETLRTDQLLLWNTSVPVSVVVSAGLVLFGVIMLLSLSYKYKVQRQKIELADQSFAPEADESTNIFDDLLNADATDNSDSEETTKTESTAAEQTETKKKIDDDDLWA